VLTKSSKLVIGPCLVLVMLFTLVACSNGLAPGEELPSAEELVAGVVEAQDNLTTGRQDFDMDMNLKVTSAGISGTVTMSMSGEVAADFLSREMQMDMNVYMKMSAQGQTQTQEVDMLMYILDDVGYIKTDMPGQPGDWEKASLSELDLEDIWEAANYISSYADLLEGADITIQKVQTVNGVPCYVVEVRPSKASLADFVEQQQAATDTELGIDYSEMFQDFTVKYWIAKDSYDIIKATVNATLHLEQAGDEYSGNMTMTANGWDYGESISIEPPAAALNAE
jgi:hypothetical protein